MISEACDFASFIISATRVSALDRLCLSSSPAATPSAICFCRVSMARISGGQMNFQQSQMNTPKETACISIVRLMFMELPFSFCLRLSQPGGNQWIAEGEQHSDAQPDDEGGVDQAEQQEHLCLQRGDHLGLPSRAFKKARAHDAHAHAGAERAQPDHQSDADAGVGLDLRNQLQLVHSFSFLKGWNVRIRRDA